MDNIDTAIIETLRQDARTPFLQIAKRLKVSEGTIRKRVKDLVADRVIERFTIETKNEQFAIVGIQTETKTHTKTIVDIIKKLGVGHVYEITGRFDVICMIPSTDPHMVNEKLEKIRTIHGVLHTETFTVLERH